MRFAIPGAAVQGGRTKLGETSKKQSRMGSRKRAGISLFGRALPSTAGGFRLLAIAAVCLLRTAPNRTHHHGYHLIGLLRFFSLQPFLKWNLTPAP